MLYISEDVTNPALRSAIEAQANHTGFMVTKNIAEATCFIAISMDSFPQNIIPSQKILLVDPRVVIAVSTKVHLVSQFNLVNIDSGLILAEMLENLMLLQADAA